MGQTRGKVLGGGIVAALALATPVVMNWESLVTTTYRDPIGIPTACYGHTGTDVHTGQVYTTDQCLQILQKDESADVDAVLDCVHIDLQPWQAASLVSFVHNVGKGALCESTLARLANAGATPETWCAQMKNWVYAHKGGQAIKLQGLVNRRDAEYNICIGKPAGGPT